MTSKLEETFGIPPSDQESEDISDQMIQEQEGEAVKLLNALTNAEKIDVALATVEDLQSYVDEMDEISKKALDAYEEMVRLGMNAPISNAARLLEVSNMMLRTALDARSNKAVHKLRTVELQIRKARLDQEGHGAEPVGAGLGHKEIVDLVKERLLQGPSEPSNPDKNNEN